MSQPNFSHVILTSGDILVVSGGAATEILRTGWNQSGGLALAFFASAFDNSNNTTSQLQAQIQLDINGAEFQSTLGLLPNNVLATVGDPNATVAKHDALSSLWVGKLNQGDVITALMTVTGDAGNIKVNNLNTHLTLLVFPAG